MWPEMGKIDFVSRDLMIFGGLLGKISEGCGVLLDVHGECCVLVALDAHSTKVGVDLLARINAPAFAFPRRLFKQGELK